jgi:hypothetical protein
MGQAILFITKAQTTGKKQTANKAVTVEPQQ